MRDDRNDNNHIDQLGRNKSTGLTNDAFKSENHNYRRKSFLFILIIPMRVSNQMFQTSFKQYMYIELSIRVGKCATS